MCEQVITTHFVSESDMSIEINLDLMLVKRGMTLTELSDRVGIALSNMSKLKNGKVKTIRLSTLDKICQELDCKPGDILDYKEV